MRMVKERAPGREAIKSAKQMINSVMKGVPTVLILQAIAAPEDWMHL